MFDPIPTTLPPPLIFEIVVDDEKLLLLLLPRVACPLYGGGAGVTAGFAVLFEMISGECGCFKYGLPYAAEYLGSILRSD